MANSINTNAGALIALQNLNATNRDLNVTQNRVNTGLKVSTAKDNGAIFAIATSQRAEMGALDSVKQSIQRGQSIVDVALAAGEIVTKALEEQKGLAVAIASSTGAAQTAYLADFNALGNEITKALGGASFDGVNLFSANTDAVEVRTGTGAGATFTLKAAGGAATTVATATGTADATTATAAAVEGAITAFTAVLGDLGTKSKSMDRQLTFVSKMQDSLEVGIGNLVDADLAKESARLTALQTKQQLGVQALSIANQSSSILLGLFR
ncbi:Flagellin [Brevundimonas diminuta]|jgi:flagellin|uniref:flagellin n=1 Tax=Brevundimonas TaxID=41275 RepID=UPI000207F576|nr:MULTISPECIES: flagellin [Brevundimonas]EGF95080.1 flagellin fljK [Brevundimonas diminuta ATCC 11568]MCZ4108616.1 flagellin [Brevundimonas diminuta]OWR16718.1 flagellin [Brevundimonas diminuta]WQE46138.1 flagellin [Brevundimonas diminuta]SPU48416.1 Flagellin [Brevundimonas diminuta]